MTEVIQYEVARESRVTISEIQEFASSVWTELHCAGSAAHRQALRRGIDVSQLPKELGDALTIKPNVAGYDPSSILMLVTGAVLAGGSRVGLDVWKFVILPQFRARWGDHALREKREPAEVSEKGGPKKPKRGQGR